MKNMCSNKVEKAKRSGSQQVKLVGGNMCKTRVQRSIKHKQRERGWDKNPPIWRVRGCRSPSGRRISWGLPRIFQDEKSKNPRRLCREAEWRMRRTGRGGGGRGERRGPSVSWRSLLLSLHPKNDVLCAAELETFQNK